MNIFKTLLGTVERSHVLLAQLSKLESDIRGMSARVDNTMRKMAAPCNENERKIWMLVMDHRAAMESYRETRDNRMLDFAESIQCAVEFYRRKQEEDCGSF